MYKNNVLKVFYYQMVVDNVLHLMVAKTKNNLIFVFQNIGTQKRAQPIETQKRL